MKFIYVSDIHGNNKKFEKLINLCKENGISNIVYGGDFCPKRSNNEQKGMFIVNYIDPFFKKLEDNKINLIYVYGNDDPECHESLFDNISNKYPNIYNIHNNLLELNGISFIGSSNVLDNPFFCKDWIVNEESYVPLPPVHDKVLIRKSSMEVDVNDWLNIYIKELPYMKDILSKLPENNNANNKVIYVFHCPPSDVSLDICSNGFHAGSKDIYNFISQMKPYMTFHGHIHESYEVGGVWKALIRNTISVQPGQYESNIDKLVYVVVDTDYNTILRKEAPC